MVQDRQILIFYTMLAGTIFLAFLSQSAAFFLLHIAYIKTVDGTTDLVRYSSQLSVIGILIEGIAEQGDEQ